MQPDLWSLYGLMYKSRVFEEAVRQIWKDGKISGEMHLGMGEEAIVAGIVSQLIEGDALALDHRGTPPMMMRGVDPVALLCEFMGLPDGLCKGMGGHMHLFAPEKLIASSGIVGAAGSMNLAVVWKLPIIFVCKDNDWAITTQASTAVGGNLSARAQAFGMKAIEVDGADVLAVWSEAEQALQHARMGKGPVFLWAHCIHLEGHFLGDGLLDMVRRPVYSFRKRIWPLLKGFFYRGGADWGERMASMRQTLEMVFAAQSQTSSVRDPLVRTRQLLVKKDAGRLLELESDIKGEIQKIVISALQSESEVA
jgi:hypothetical protein